MLSIVHLERLLELAAREAEAVDVHVLRLGILPGHHVHVGIAAQLGVQVADLGVAEVQVEPEILPEEAVPLPEGRRVEVRVQVLLGEPLQQEFHEALVLLVQVALDVGDHRVEPGLTGILEIHGQVGETRDDIFEITHPNRSFFVAGRR